MSVVPRDAAGASNWGFIWNNGHREAVINRSVTNVIVVNSYQFGK